MYARAGVFIVSFFNVCQRFVRVSSEKYGRIQHKPALKKKKKEKRKIEFRMTKNLHLARKSFVVKNLFLSFFSMISAATQPKSTFFFRDLEIIVCFSPILFQVS